MKITRQALLTLLLLPFALVFLVKALSWQHPKSMATGQGEMDRPAPQRHPREGNIPTQSPLPETPYTVMKGDTVQMLGRIFLTSEEAIRKLNGMAPGQEVVPGQVIMIPPLAEP